MLPANRVIAPSAIKPAQDNPLTAAPCPVPDAMSTFDIHHVITGFVETTKAVADAHLKDLALQDKYGIHVRIGICAGEPVEEDQHLFGSTVQLTSRICGKAAPDQKLVAPVKKDLCLWKSFAFADRGEHALKGFDQPLRMYEVQWRG